MFIDSFIRTLFLDLPNILLPVALHAEGEVDGISGLAPNFVPDVELLIPCLVGKVGCSYYVPAAFCIRSASTWSTPSIYPVFFSHCPIFADSRLTQNIS